MAKDRSALRSGVLLIVSVVLIVLVIIGIKGLSWVSDPVETHLVAFDLKTNISGLRIGDEVRVGGFKVGEIKRITLRTREDDPNHPPHLLVTYTFPRKFVIHEDAKLRIDGTLTGTSWLNFEDLGTGKKVEPGTPLVGGPSPTSELLAMVGGLAPEVKAIVGDVRTKTLPTANDTIKKFGDTADAFKKTGDSATLLTTDVRTSYKPAIDKYHALADKAIVMMEAIRALFGDTTDDFRTTIANLRKSTDSVRDKLPAILDKVDSSMAKVQTALDSVNKTLGEVNTTMVNARDISATAKAVIVGNKSKLDAMIDSVKKAGDNLKNATAEIRHSPWRLLYKPAPGEVANLNLYDSTRQFAEGANDLDDAATALRDALKANPNDPKAMKELMDKLDKAFAKFQEVEQKLWTNVKE